MDTVLEETQLKENVKDSDPRKSVGVLGVPLAYGASMAGVDMGPAALRVAGLIERVGELGYEVRDLGDLRLERSRTVAAPGDKLKYLSQIKAACEGLAKNVEEILEAGDLPLSLGGDHSIAIGSIAGFSAHCRKRNETPGLI